MLALNFTGIIIVADTRQNWNLVRALMTTHRERLARREEYTSS